MTNILVDTQVLIWIQTDSDRITSKAHNLLINPLVVKWISEVSLLEIAIKQKIGKLPEFNLTLTEFVEQAEKDKFHILPILRRYIIAYEQIPLINDHRDPFDRLILAMAKAENWPVLSSDPKFS